MTLVSREQQNWVERAQPLLGTYVSIRIEGLAPREAHRAIDAGFAAVQDVHRLMSFHEADSDVSRLNRDAATSGVGIDARTFEVLQRAQDIAAASHGVFDVTVAGRLVRWGFLPKPLACGRPDPRATWRDIVLERNALKGHATVRFLRPLWIDLGGIAKGYAVDRALAAMALPSGIRCCINAGGDLRLSGPGTERVGLRLPWRTDTVPVVEIEDGALASSTGHGYQRRHRGRNVGPHLDGAKGRTVGARSFASVAADDCMTADALTKVVLTNGIAAEPILRRFRAVAYLYTPQRGWRTLGQPLT